MTYKQCDYCGRIYKVPEHAEQAEEIRLLVLPTGMSKVVNNYYTNQKEICNTCLGKVYETLEEIKMNANNHEANDLIESSDSNGALLDAKELASSIKRVLSEQLSRQ